MHDRADHSGGAIECAELTKTLEPDPLAIETSSNEDLRAELARIDSMIAVLGSNRRLIWLELYGRREVCDETAEEECDA